MARPTRSMAGLTTVEVVRCLKDGSRDMTQVIYRQVPQMDIFTTNGTLRGDPLYRVNYCGSHCGYLGLGTNSLWEKHDHLLWAVGDEQLFRCRVALLFASWAGYRVDGDSPLAKKWRAGQEQIMNQPQLYLTGLRR